MDDEPLRSARWPDLMRVRLGWRRSAIAATGLCCAILGATTLASWLLRLDAPWAQAMPNAALGLLLDGLALVAIAFGRSWVALVGASWSLLLGTATLAEYLFSIDLHIDNALVRHFREGPFPGRIGPNVAFCFVLIGIVLLWASARRPRWRWIGTMGLFGGVVLATGLLSIVGRLQVLPAQGGWSLVVPRVGALDAALGFSLLGAAFLLVVWLRDSEPESGLSPRLTLSVAAGGLIVALCFGQALSGLNLDRTSEIARTVRLTPEEIREVTRAVQGNLPLVLAMIGSLVTVLMVLMADQTLASRRHAHASQLLAGKLAQEIAERQQAEIALREQAALLRLAHDAILVTDRGGRISFWNRGAEETYGWRAEDAVGRNACELLHTASSVRLEEIEAALLERTEWAGELNHVTRDGRKIVVTSRWSLQRDDAGKISAVLQIDRDITEQKRAEEEIKTLNAGLERRVAERTAELVSVNRELEAFSYSVSHDLRAPLRAVDGFSTLLRERHADQLGEEARSLLERIHAASQRMGSLIEGMLTLSRITRRELQRAMVDMSALAEEVARDLRDTAPARNVEFVIPPGVFVYADSDLLRIVLENLLGNAWKFTGRHPQGRIEVGATQRDGETAYFVRDDGAGFDMAVSNQLFGAFQRLHSSREFEGTGIGLASVQRVVNRHGGRVWAEAEVEKGACFFFTFPTAPGETSTPSAALPKGLDRADTPMKSDKAASGSTEETWGSKPASMAAREAE